jgi:DNA helicase HerA-like ATPase
MSKLKDGFIYLGGASDGKGPDQYLDLKLANRHGLVTGATGTGKTVTLQVLAEGFSEAGVPVFAADIKGDLSGVSAKGEPKDFLLKRARDIGLDGYEGSFSGAPVVFWDLFGEQGHPIRATVSEMGPLLLSRLLNLNETQEGVLNIVFRFADDAGLLLLDLKDLRDTIAFVGSNKELQTRLKATYGNISAASIGAIQRQLLVLEQQGGLKFFGEPALDLKDLMRTGPQGRGVVNLLAADRLMGSPRLYATFLLWLLSELFEELPEVGDPEKPKLVFFFDEAHLLFDDAPDALLDKVEQVVRLVRSKGVGVYFVTQNPLDVPDKVSAQLGNRVQHALRAFTPREQRSVRAAAETFRPNPKIDVARAITELGTGEALVSVLEAKGAPSIVERTLIRPPSARIGPVTADERRQLIARSPMAGRYDEVEDRDSASEMLARRVAGEERATEERYVGPAGPGTGKPMGAPGPWGGPPRPQPEAPQGGRWTDWLGGMLGGGPEPVGPRGGRRPQRQSVPEIIVKGVARSASSTVGRAVTTAILRGIFGTARRR